MTTNSTTSIRPIVRVAAALVVATVGVFAGAVQAVAEPADRSPMLTVSGSDSWAPRPHGDVVVNGTAEVTWRSSATARSSWLQ